MAPNKSLGEFLSQEVKGCDQCELNAGTELVEMLKRLKQFLELD